MCHPINIAAIVLTLFFSLISSALGQVRIPYGHKMVMLPVSNEDKYGTGGQEMADFTRESTIQAFNQRNIEDGYRFTVPAFSEVQRVSKEAKLSLVARDNGSTAACARLLDCDCAIYEKLVWVRVTRGPLGGIQSVSAAVQIHLRSMPSGVFINGAAEIGESIGTESLPTMEDAVRAAVRKCVQSIQAYRLPEGTVSNGGHSPTITIGKRDGVEPDMVFAAFRNDEVVGEIKVTKVADDYAFFEVIKDLNGVAPFDTVIAMYADRGVSYADTPRRKRRPPIVDVWN